MTLAAVIVTTMVLQSPPSAPASTGVPGGCEQPAAAHAGEMGCYLVATVPLGELPDGPLFWHLYRYRSRADAERAAAPRTTIVESVGRVWAYTIAERGWAPAGGERVAVIGPLTADPGTPYTARYMEARFGPGMRTAVHRHSGVEAWYVVSGAQCLETPETITVVKAGDGAVVPAGPPMVLSTVGAETRRSVLLVLHDSGQPWMSAASDWRPAGRCPQ